MNEVLRSTLLNPYDTLQAELEKRSPEEETPPTSLGQLIDSMQKVRQKKRDLEDDLNEVKAEYNQLESEVMRRLKDADLDKASGSLATASIKITVYPTVKNADLFAEYIRANEADYLLTGTPSSPACRELWATGETIPGVEPFEKITINLRTL